MDIEKDKNLIKLMYIGWRKDPDILTENLQNELNIVKKHAKQKHSHHLTSLYTNFNELKKFMKIK